jgi:DNA end-binding protein Ku
LISIPVEIYPATKSGAQISFRQIHEPSGKRIKYEKIVPGIGPIDPDDIIKGFEYEKDSYVLLDQDEIDAVKLESKRTLALTQFVDPFDIDVLYYEKPYYVVPADDLAEEAYVVLRDALRKTKKVGIGQLAVRGQEHVISLKPCGNPTGSPQPCPGKSERAKYSSTGSATSAARPLSLPIQPGPDRARRWPLR